MTEIRTWRTRPIEVQAIRWLGEENCEEAFAFLGWTHPDDEDDHSLIHGLGPDGKQEAAPGDWIVRDEDGVAEVFTDTAFHAEFEPASQPETYTWAKSISADSDGIRIPANRGGTWIGDIKLPTKDARQLWTMLGYFLDAIGPDQFEAADDAR